MVRVRREGRVGGVLKGEIVFPTAFGGVTRTDKRETAVDRRLGSAVTTRNDKITAVATRFRSQPGYIARVLYSARRGRNF